MKDVFNNDFKTTIKKRTCDVNNAKKIMREITARNISKNEPNKLHGNLIQKDIDALKREKSNNIRKYNILDILNIVGAIFTGTYLHYEDVLKETMFKRSVAERIKFRKEKLNLKKIKLKEIKKKITKIKN